MTSKVYFIDMRATIKENFIQKIGRLMETAGIASAVGERDLTAVKIHFGELGNAAFIRPVYIRKVVEEIQLDYAEKPGLGTRAYDLVEL